MDVNHNRKLVCKNKYYTLEKHTINGNIIATYWDDDDESITTKVYSGYTLDEVQEALVELLGLKPYYQVNIDSYYHQPDGTVTMVYLKPEDAEDLPWVYEDEYTADCIAQD